MKEKILLTGEDKYDIPAKGNHMLKKENKEKKKKSLWYLCSEQRSIAKTNSLRKI